MNYIYKSFKPENSYQSSISFPISAGIYSTWVNPVTDESINSYSIFTTEANELMAEIHNNKKRMPVVLKKQDHQAWLSSKDHQNFAFPYDVPLIATAVE